MEHPVPLPRAKSRTRIPVPSQRRDNQDMDSENPTPTIVHVAEVHSTRKDSKTGSSGEGEAEDSSGITSPEGGEKRKKKVRRRGTFLVRHKSPVEWTTDETNNPTPSDKEAMETTGVRKLSSALPSSKASSVESIKLPMEDTTSSGTPKPSSQIRGFGAEKKIGASSTESVKEVTGETGFKKPSVPSRRGSATETLSESSTERERGRIKLKPLARHKKVSGYATETLSEDSSQRNSPARVSSAPMPRPRQKVLVSGTLTSPDESQILLARQATFCKSTQEEATRKKITDVQAMSRRGSYTIEPAQPVGATSRRGSYTIGPIQNEEVQEIPDQMKQPVPSPLGPPITPETEPEVKERKDTPQIQRISPGPTASASGSTKPTPDSPSYYTSSSVDYKDTGVIPQPKAKRPKKKRKIKDDSGASSDNSEKGSDPSTNMSKDDASDHVLVDKDTVICITVHRCEPLRLKDLHRRPAVRLHLMDVRTKSYRRSAFGKNSVDIVQTQQFDHILNRSVVPTWEEDLIFMKPVSHVVAADCVLIFELLEVETEEVIAWAFLKPLAANGKNNVGTLLRLQLYKPVKSRNSKSDDTALPQAFNWYMRSKMSSYRSTMLVSLHAIDSKLVMRPDSPTVSNPVIPSKNHTRRRSSQMTSSPAHMKLSEAEKELIGVVWSRLPSLSCKLPNKVNSSLPAGPDGGMSVCYSRSGLLVACHTSNTISVFTYRGSRYLTLSGHHGLVYDLSWSPDDSFLLSASADTTACVWNIKLKQTAPVGVLSHPSYVYCATWVGSSLVVTGCYDRAVRLWDLAGVPTLLPQNSSVSGSHVHPSATYEPLQCAVVHKARVNSLAVLSSDEILVSGDSDGVLIFWKLSTTVPRQLELSREVKLRELRNQVINKVSAHPGGKRILVATRDSTLRMIDLQSTSVIQWFHGGVNSKLQNGSCFCGCGSRVLSCSEDGTVSMWDANTGERIAIYKGLFLPESPATLSFHPKDNMLALVSHKVGAFPALVLSAFCRDGSGGDIGIEWLDNRSEKLGSSSSVSDLSLKSSRESVRERSSSRKKKKGILRALLQGGTKSKHKKGVSNDGYTDTESGEGAASDVGRSERRKRSAYKIMESLDTDGEVNHRLTDIIKRMDDLISTAAPNRTQVF